MRQPSMPSNLFAPSEEDMDRDDSCSVALGPVAPSSDNDGEQEPYLCPTVRPRSRLRSIAG